ncbi:MAG: hypothetical protein IPI81_12780 [Flavobacteriales bacterium]|nr:hypothetical protein [Flavobacteriales bacterium]MCC6937973.1 hypothetical protein [Flavobacteriales bacterium]
MRGQGSRSHGPAARVTMAGGLLRYDPGTEDEVLHDPRARPMVWISG